MCVLKRKFLVILVAVLASNGNCFAFAGQDGDQGMLQENRKQLMETNSCPGCDLSGVNLDSVNLSGANLEGANLSRARMHLAVLAKANLRNTDLREATFGGADLVEADLRGADLRGATFAGAYLVGAILDNGVTLNQHSHEFVSDTISVQNIVDENALSISSEKPGFFDSTLEGVKSLFGLSEDSPVVQPLPENDPATDIEEQLIEVTGSEGATLPQEPGFFDSTLVGVKGLFGLSEDAPVVQPLPENDPAADNVPAIEEQLIEVTGNESATLPHKPRFFDITLGGVKGLFGLSEDTPVVQPLPENDPVADIVPAEEEQLIEATGNEDATPSGKPSFLDSTIESVKGLFGQGESVDRETVVEDSESVVQGATLSNENETAGVTASGDLLDPAVEGEKNRMRLLDANRCYGCSLVGVDLAGKNLDRADLEGSDLTSSNLQGADLEKANLKGAILVRVNLRNADLRGADLYKANLSEADLTGARLEGAFLDDAQLSDVVGYDPKDEQ